MTASIAAASLLGAPLMHDFCHISLSDLLTPRPVIEKRIVAAGEADFVICFYNPAAAAAKDIWRAPLRCWRPVKRRYAGRRSQIRRTQKAGEMADHPRGDGFCPSGYDQSGDRWQQSDLHRQRPDDHPARLRAVNHGDVLVIGGTSDARAICQQLDAADVRYTLSVATPTGERLAGDIRGQIRCGRMEWQQMAEWLRAQRTRWVIDASHPYAEVVSQNIVRACASVGVLLSRYQRPEQLSDLRHPLLHVVGDLNEACAVARRFGERILLTTGSKDLAARRAGLAEKTLLARVLPVPEVVQHCSDLGFGVGEIFALCGPFSAEFNAAFIASAGPMLW